MKKNVTGYVIISGIVVLVGVLLMVVIKNLASYNNGVIEMNGNNIFGENEIIIEHNENYAINYTDGGYVYNINSYANKNYIYVKKTEMVLCESLDCVDNIVDEYNIYLEGNKLNYVQGFIKSLFIKSEGNNISKDNILEEDFNVMEGIINNDYNSFPNEKNVYYEIAFSTDRGAIIKQGYKISKKQDYYSLSIGMGYSLLNSYITIENIEKINNVLFIKVRENYSDDMGDKIATALTTPLIEINVYEEFNDIIIKNTDGIVYEKLES